MDSEILLYQTEDGQTQLEVRFRDETAWLSQAQLAELFQTSKQNISLHVRNIFQEAELDQNRVVREYLTTASDGKRYRVQHFNLDVIISVGYRVRSHRGTQFRRWATTQLRDFLVRGYLLNDERFRETGGDRYFDELLERIRDIRSSEKVFWRKVLEIYATSVDYDPNALATELFFSTVQNKMHWAAHGHTAAEIVVERADSNKPNMGMTNFPGRRAIKADARVAKNYLNENELSALNRIVNLYLEFAELQALNRKTMTMAAWISKLDEFLILSERELLNHAGSVSKLEAERKADTEYEIWRALRAETESAVERDFKKAIESVKRVKKKKITRSRGQQEGQ